jgi:glutamate synthase (NADPH) small chain
MNSLPAVCGRVCPQEIQCEGQMHPRQKGRTGGHRQSGALRGRLRAGITAPANCRPRPPPTGKEGGGGRIRALGLTVAGDLIQKGHEVTVFEAFHKPGGVLVYGIPEFRLPKEIVAQEVNFLERLGVKVECNAVVGRTVTLDELFEQGYEAVFPRRGAGLPRFMNIPGENLVGILSANEYLTRANLMKAYLFPEVDTPIPRGKERGGAGRRQRGHGRRPHRHASGSGQRADRLPPLPRGDAGPERPKSTMPRRRGSSSSCSPTRPAISATRRGAWSGMECLKMELGEPDASGRRRPVAVKGSEFTHRLRSVHRGRGFRAPTRC